MTVPETIELCLDLLANTEKREGFPQLTSRRQNTVHVRKNVIEFDPGFSLLSRLPSPKLFAFNQLDLMHTVSSGSYHVAAGLCQLRRVALEVCSTFTYFPVQSNRRKP